MVLAELRGVEKILRDRIEFVEAELEKQPQEWLATSGKEGKNHLAQVQRWIKQRESEDLVRPAPPWQELGLPGIHE